MSSNPDLQRWNAKYDAGDIAVDPRAEPELVDYLPKSACSGLALELACGRGANALYLATRGYDVIAMDGAASALKSCRISAQKLGLKVSPIVQDLETVVLPTERFDLICVIRYLQRSLAPQIVAALKPGGYVFFKTFNLNFLRERPEFNSDYVLATGELESMFSDFTTIQARDDDQPETSSFILARKPVSALSEQQER